MNVERFKAIHARLRNGQDTNLAIDTLGELISETDRLTEALSQCRDECRQLLAEASRARKELDETRQELENARKTARRYYGAMRTARAQVESYLSGHDNGMRFALGTLKAQEEIPWED